VHISAADWAAACTEQARYLKNALFAQKQCSAINEENRFSTFNSAVFIHYDPTPL
jgi:hypothetical protein